MIMAIVIVVVGILNVVALFCPLGRSTRSTSHQPPRKAQRTTDMDTQKKCALKKALTLPITVCVTVLAIAALVAAEFSMMAWLGSGLGFFLFMGLMAVVFAVVIALEAVCVYRKSIDESQNTTERINERGGRVRIVWKVLLLSCCLFGCVMLCISAWRCLHFFQHILLIAICVNALTNLSYKFDSAWPVERT